MTDFAEQMWGGKPPKPEVFLHCPHCGGADLHEKGCPFTNLTPVEVSHMLGDRVQQESEDHILDCYALINQQKAELEQLRDFANWIDTWVRNPAGAYSSSALDGLFGMTRDKIAALKRG